MTQPKAKWERMDKRGDWSATVGPYLLGVSQPEQRYSILVGGRVDRVLAQIEYAEPVDAAELMCRCEAELARRLTHAAETMDFGELQFAGQAPPPEYVQLVDRFLEEVEDRPCCENVHCQGTCSAAKAFLALREYGMPDTVPQTWTEIRNARGEIVGRTKPRPDYNLANVAKHVDYKQHTSVPVPAGLACAETSAEPTGTETGAGSMEFTGVVIDGVRWNTGDQVRVKRDRRIGTIVNITNVCEVALGPGGATFLFRVDELELAPDGVLSHGYPVQSAETRDNKLVVKPLAYPKEIRDIQYVDDLSKNTTATPEQAAALRGWITSRGGTLGVAQANYRVRDLLDVVAPSFKVGDLVRGCRSRRVGVVENTSGHPNIFVRFVNSGRVEERELSYVAVIEPLSHVAVIEPYQLPPIKTYADLADVLDELPEGTVLEVVAQPGNEPWFVKRCRGEEYAGRVGSGGPWLLARALLGRDPGLLAPFTTIRVLPPEGATRS